MAKKIVGDLSLELLGYNQSVINIDANIVDDGTAQDILGDNAEDGRAVWNMIGKVGADVTIGWKNRTFFGRVLNVYVAENAYLYAEVNGLFNGDETSVLGLVTFIALKDDPGSDGKGGALLQYMAFPADGD